MTVTVKVDAQGRVVIPQAEREPLGLPRGGALGLVSTPEGVLLERRRRAAVTSGEDGLPLVTTHEFHVLARPHVAASVRSQVTGIVLAETWAALRRAPWNLDARMVEATLAP